MHFGIAGAGLLGRLLAFRLVQSHHKVTLFDKDISSGFLSCGMTAAGMLTPYAEITAATEDIVDWGLCSIDLWKRYLSDLQRPEILTLTGTILLAHHQDRPVLQRFLGQLNYKMQSKCSIQNLAHAELNALEPELNPMGEAYHILNEGFINNVALFSCLYEWLNQQESVVWRENSTVERVSEALIKADGCDYTFDYTIDCRGMGAKDALPGLRGVRGEVITVHAPDVNISHMLRLMHPRYPLYIVPRPDHHYVIGASEIESEDYSPVSVRSALELLSALSTVHAGFLEARIVRMQSNCRPTLSDNMPIIQHSKHSMAVNGLYRHGFLLAPKVVEGVINYIVCREREGQYDYNTV